MSVQWTNYNTLWSRLTHSQRKQCKDWNYYYGTSFAHRNGGTDVYGFCGTVVVEILQAVLSDLSFADETVSRCRLGKVQAENLTMPLGMTELLIQLPMESAIRMDTADGSMTGQHLSCTTSGSAKSDLGTLIVGIDGLMNGGQERYLLLLSRCRAVNRVPSG